MPTTDFTVANHGSIYLLNPCTLAADDWLAENIGKDAIRLGGAVAVEPRYTFAIIEGIINDGLTVGDA